MASALKKREIRLSFRASSHSSLLIFSDAVGSLLRAWLELSHHTQRDGKHDLLYLIKKYSDELAVERLAPTSSKHLF